MKVHVLVLIMLALPELSFSESVSELDLHDSFATALACQFIENEDAEGLSEVNFSAQQLADAVEAYEPGQVFTEADVESFRWRAAMPENCELYNGEDVRFGAYLINELLSILSQAAGVSIDWADVTERATGESCEQTEAFMASVDKELMEPIGDELDRLMSSHPVFGDDDGPAGLAELKIRWRAYWLGRYRERELSEQAVEDYAFAFEAFPEEGSRHELSFQQMGLPLFYTSDEFSPERLTAFGTVSSDGQRGLDLASYIARQQAWNFLFSGEFRFPVQAPDDGRALALKEDLILNLRGQLPGPEACHPVEYWEVRGGYNAILRGVVAFVNEHLNKRLDALVEAAEQAESATIESADPLSTIVEPGIAQWSGADCAQPIVRATGRYIPKDPPLLDGEPEFVHTFFDGSTTGPPDTLAWTTVRYGVPEDMRDSGWELDADQADRVRRGDVVSEIWRTTLERLDLFELSWCDTETLFPVMPGGFSLSVPAVSAREVEVLWSR